MGRTRAVLAGNLDQALTLMSLSSYPHPGPRLRTGMPRPGPCEVSTMAWERRLRYLGTSGSSFLPR